MASRVRKLKDRLQALGLSMQPRELPIGKLPRELVLDIIDKAAQLDPDRARKVLDMADQQETKSRPGKKGSKYVKQKSSWVENWPILRLGQTNKFFNEHCQDAFFRRTTFDLNLNCVLIQTLLTKSHLDDDLGSYLDDDLKEGLSRLMWCASIGGRKLPEQLNGRITHIRVGEAAMLFASSLWEVMTTNGLVPFRASGFSNPQTIPAEWSDGRKAQYQAGIAGELFHGVTSMTVSLSDESLFTDFVGDEENLYDALDGDEDGKSSAAALSAYVSNWLKFFPNLKHVVVEREGHFWDIPSEDGIWTPDQITTWLRSGDSLTFELLIEAAAEHPDDLAYDSQDRKFVLRSKLNEKTADLVRKEERRLKAQLLQEDR